MQSSIDYTKKVSVRLQKNRFLSEFSTFKIGGPIEAFVEAKSAEEIEKAFLWASQENLPILILGKCSNCLFGDGAFPGLVILNRIDFCHTDGKEIHVGAGYSFSLLGVQTARNGFSGLEFASGIPATVGGAVYMNAGANGQEVSETLKSVSYLERNGQRREFSREELFFSYRTSPFQKMEGAILSARFTLRENKEARKAQLALIERRMQTQPLKDKSAGCVFRNPSKEVSAGALIDRCGLKGFRVGGAKVSEVHANFLINEDQATAQDVKELIAHVQEKVLKEAGMHLETEIRIL
jgi:UDP-N-acetylmuramate dehydrogenase